MFIKSYIQCGKVFEPELPKELDASQPPIVLATVAVNVKHIPRPHVLIKFSEFINFTLLGLNPKISIFYRLVRKDNCSIYEQILQEWQFEFESAEISEIANVDTNQPTVLNFCDCLDQCASDSFTYRLEIFQIETNNVRSYDLMNKSISATIINGADEYCKISCSDRVRHHESMMPFVKCGKVFNPVLPLQLSKEDQPVILTQLTINTVSNCNTCILVNFSSFITSILKENRFNDLTFRLVRTCPNLNKEILKEWPFRRAFVNDTNIKEPLVYNYCECLNNTSNMPCTYTLELVKVRLSEKSSYNITQKSMTASVYCKINQPRFW